MIVTGLGLVLVSGWMVSLHGEMAGKPDPRDTGRLPILMAHQGSAPGLDRPPAVFDHDRHTAALKQGKAEDCAVCHVLKETDKRLITPEVKVFAFPKTGFDQTDKTAAMYAYHGACVGCHRKMVNEGKKTGPDVGLCGKCHVRAPQVRTVAWAWSPLFNYLRHSKHLQAAERWGPGSGINVAQNVTVVGEVTGKKCETCHHTSDEAAKKLIYKKDTENSCRACHKAADEKNARSMKKVAHAACVGCHVKLRETVTAELARQGRTELTDEDRKRFGPIECKGCHGEHKVLTPDEIRKIPRLVRGQKDVMDLALKAEPGVPTQGTQQVSLTAAGPVRMKAVPFNHKAHEPRAQFCGTCHHHSLEKCVNCHTTQGDAKKGGGITYERAFHLVRGQQSCAGCHETAKQDMKCAGCHQWIRTEAPKSACAVCHRGPFGDKVVEIPPAPLFLDKEKVPEKLLIKALEKEFKPADMPHMKIVNKLVAVSNESTLARWFHASRENTLCSGCHHRGDLQQAAVQAPKCTMCHNRSFDPASLGKPGAAAAFHRQCMGCHQAMKQKPAALECTKCHPAKEGAQTAGLPGLK